MIHQNLFRKEVRTTGKRKYEHRNMITRTLATTTGDVTYFDTDAKENKVITITLNGSMDAETFLKKVNVNGITLMAENVETTETLYAITVDDFIAHAIIIE